MYHKVRQELKERYESTGRIGFFKPKDINEAYSIIETLSEVYRQQKEEPEEVVLNLSDLTERLRNFFKNF